MILKIRDYMLVVLSPLALLGLFALELSRMLKNMVTK